MSSPNPTTEAMPRVSKGVLSQFLRTGCRRQLFLSIYSPHRKRPELAAMNLPPLAKWRPGLHHMARIGKSLEEVRYEEVLEAFGAGASNFKTTGNNAMKAQTAFLTALKGTVNAPHVFVEAQFDSHSLSTLFYAAIGVAPADLSTLPPLADLRPDLVLAMPAHMPLPADRRARQVLPSGETAPIAADDTRLWLLPVDIKHAENINASYAVEVTLYSVLLALWLEHEGLADRYIVVDQPALWTIDPPDAPPMARLKSFPAHERMACLLQRVEVVEFDQYVISMRKIFCEDVLAVAKVQTLNALEPHVGTYCNMCDFYAHPGWAPTNKKTGVTETVHAEHCSTKSGNIDHLSRIPDMSRGMARTLREGAVPTVSTLAAQTPTAPVFQEHNRLTAERHLLPRRAQHLLSGTRDTTGRQCATLPRFSHLSVYIIINFDASTGLTTGFAVYGNYLPQRAYQPDPQPWEPTDDPKRRPDAWTVDRRDLECEYEGLVRVVCELNDLIDAAQADKRHEDVKQATLQVYFWDARQYEHFRTVVGRHLHRLLLEPKLKGLVWMFPPDELLPHPDYAATPAVTFVKDAIARLEILPIPHALTLLSVAGALLEHPPTISPYLHEPLSDAIPKERIYEIWAPSGSRNRQQLVNEYNGTLKVMVMTLMQIAAMVQKTYKSALTATPPKLGLLTLPQLQKVSMDGQLLVYHAQLEDETERTAAKVTYGRDPDELEAEYRSIRLVARLQGSVFETTRLHLGLAPDPHLRIFSVTEASANSRLKLGDRVTFFIDDQPGLLNVKASKLLGKREDLKANYTVLAEVLRAQIVAFDRVGRWVAVTATDDYAATHFSPVIQALEATGLRFDAGCSLVEGPPPMIGAPRKEAFQRALGSPLIAQPYNQALAALARHPSAAPKASSVEHSRGAAMLWDAPTMAVTRTAHADSQIAAAITWLKNQGHLINDSQEKAMTHACAYGLSQLWGPPGTGKTQTGAGIAAAEVWLTNAGPGHTNVLVTGPNYQAVETIYAEVAPLLAKMGKLACRVRWINRKSPAGELDTQLDYANCNPRDLGPLQAELDDPVTPTIVFAVVHQLFKLSGLSDGKNIPKKKAVPKLGRFHLVMIDEASQVDMAYACGALVHLHEIGRLVLLGDRLQMPPISSVEPPAKVEFLVGSILDYYKGRFPDLEEDPLLINYRSSEPLIAFARDLGYPLKLTSAHPNAHLVLTGPGGQPEDWPESLPWSDLFPALLDPQRVTMAVTYPDGKAGQANEFEADLVAACVALARRRVLAGLGGRGDPPNALADAKRFWTQSIGIVTPHRAQRAAIIRKLRVIFPVDDPALIEDAVDTVERFQGGERDIILVSFGVGDPDLIAQEEEFLLGLNRTNVAISRARAKVVVFVSDELSYHLPDDVDIVRTARAVKGYVHQYCHQRQAVDVGDRTVTLRWRDNLTTPAGS